MTNGEKRYIADLMASCEYNILHSKEISFPVPVECNGFSKGYLVLKGYDFAWFSDGLCRLIAVPLEDPDLCALRNMGQLTNKNLIKLIDKIDPSQYSKGYLFSYSVSETYCSETHNAVIQLLDSKEIVVNDSFLRDVVRAFGKTKKSFIYLSNYSCVDPLIFTHQSSYGFTYCYIMPIRRGNHEQSIK